MYEIAGELGIDNYCWVSCAGHVELLIIAHSSITRGQVQGF